MGPKWFPGGLLEHHGLLKAPCQRSHVAVIIADFRILQYVLEEDIDWETWESCLINLGPATATSDVNEYGEVETTADINIDNNFYQFSAENGTTWSQVSGVLGYSFEAFKIWPRSAADLVE